MSEMTDKRRSEIIENLRFDAEYGSYNSLTEWFSEFYLTITGIDDFPDVRELSGALADLIERPTCTMDLNESEYMSTDVRTWEYSSCGQSHEEVYGEYEYCPHCGAKVVE